MDEPTSHLDTYSQLALEQAIEKYEGAVLMVSHDFYTDQSLTCELPLIGGVTDFLRLCRIACQQSV